MDTHKGRTDLSKIIVGTTYGEIDAAIEFLRGGATEVSFFNRGEIFDPQAFQSALRDKIEGSKKPKEKFTIKMVKLPRGNVGIACHLTLKV